MFLRVILSGILVTLLAYVYPLVSFAKHLGCFFFHPCISHIFVAETYQSLWNHVVEIHILLRYDHLLLFYSQFRYLTDSFKLYGELSSMLGDEKHASGEGCSATIQRELAEIRALSITVD